MNPMRISLTGFMGSGKSSYGAVLAKELSLDFADTDTLIETQENSTIQNIFQTKGEAFFRKMENRVLHELFEKTNIVIATGGGLPVFYENSRFIFEHSLVIFLKPELDEIYRWLKEEGDSRPLLNDIQPSMLKEHIKELYLKRLPFYRNSHLVINPEYLSPNSLADYIRKNAGSFHFMEK